MCIQMNELENKKNTKSGKCENNNTVVTVIMEELEALRGTKYHSNWLKHIIMSIEAVDYTTNKQLLVHQKRFGVDLYRPFYGQNSLYPELEKNALNTWAPCNANATKINQISFWICCMFILFLRNETINGKFVTIYFFTCKRFATDSVQQKIRNKTKKDGVKYLGITDKTMPDLRWLFFLRLCRYIDVFCAHWRAT